MESQLTPPERSMSPPRKQRACIRCAKSKAKCTFHGNNSRECERCTKLGVECIANKGKGLRKPRQLRPLNNRISTLEQRLDELTSALRTHSTITPSSSPENVDSTTQQHEPSNTEDSNSFSRQHEPSPSAPPRRNDTLPPYGLTWKQADKALSIYRNELFPHFPFVLIDDDVSSQNLLETKPAIFRAVMLVAMPLSVARLAKMKRNVLAYISQHIHVENERNIDLLQGLIIVLAWADLEVLHDAQVTNLTYMAVGYAHNLGITKIPPGLLEKIGMDDAPEDIRRHKKHMIMRHMHSLEEQRAFLACYCLLSINSAQFGRQNALSTQYVEICCAALSQATDCPTDFLVTQSVQMFHLGDRISESFGSANDDERGRPYLFLLDDHVSALRSELDCIMAGLTIDELTARLPTLSRAQVATVHSSLVLRHQFLLVRLYEPATYLRNTTDQVGNPTSYRTNCLQQCLAATIAFYNIFLAVNQGNQPHISIASMGQSTFVMVISTRLLLMDQVPGWDVAAARQALDFPASMRGIAQRLIEMDRLRQVSVIGFAKDFGVPVSKDELEVPSWLTDVAKKTEWIANWFKARIEGQSTDDSSAEHNCMSNLPPIMPAELSMTGGFQVAESAWLGDLFDSSAFGFDDFDLR